VLLRLAALWNCTEEQALSRVLAAFLASTGGGDEGDEEETLLRPFAGVGPGKALPDDGTPEALEIERAAREAALRAGPLGLMEAVLAERAEARY
jgi:hypothetical protein